MRNDEGICFINTSKCNEEEVNILVETCKKDGIAYCIAELGEAFGYTYWDKYGLSIKGRQISISIE